MRQRFLYDYWLCFGLLGICLLGCGQPTNSLDEDLPVSASLPVVSGSQLQQFISSSTIPVLVEFGVDFNCERCRSMKPDLVDLAERYRGKAEVVRVDYGSNLDLVAQYGGTICPTYVLFENGKAVEVRSYPTSQHLLEGKLIDLLSATPSQ